MAKNPNCDGAGPHAPGEVRRLPTGGDGASILCRRCFYRERAWRARRNGELEPENRFDLPAWADLKVYPEP